MVEISGLWSDTGAQAPLVYVSAVRVFWNHSLWAISPFTTVFSTNFGELSAIFIKHEIVICKLFEFGRV